MAKNAFQRMRFMAGLIFAIVKRAIPRPASKPSAEPAAKVDSEALVEAIMIGDIDALKAHGTALATGKDTEGNPWFFLALESGSQSTLAWFLENGASAKAADGLGRLPLEVLIQRLELADEFDDHLGDVERMIAAVLAAGADRDAATLTGDILRDRLNTLGLNV